MKKRFNLTVFPLVLLLLIAILAAGCTQPQDTSDSTGESSQTVTENKENITETKGNTSETTGNTTETKNNASEAKDSVTVMNRYKTVLSGPVTQYVQVDDSQSVTYTDWLNQEVSVPISIPKFVPFSDDAIACQKELETALEPVLKKIRDDAAGKYSQAWLFIKFDAYLNGDVLSVIIEREAVTGGSTYYVYNLDIATGKRLDTAALMAKIQFTDYEEKLTQAAKASFESKWGNSSTGDLYIKQLNATIDPKNIEKAMPYLGQDGKLKAATFIGSLAGASGYYEILTLS